MSLQAGNKILCWESRGFLGKMGFCSVHGEAPKESGGDTFAEWGKDYRIIFSVTF